MIGGFGGGEELRYWEGGSSSWVELPSTGAVPSFPGMQALELFEGELVTGLRAFDGSAWRRLSGGFDGTVHALAVFDDGRGPALYLGGSFDRFGSQSLERVARWDGMTLEALGSGIGEFGSSVSSLAVFDDGSGAGERLYAGGLFDRAGQAEVRNFAAWDGQSWSDVGGGADGQILALAKVDQIAGGPWLAVGGDFDSVGASRGSTVVSHVALWDGTSWSGLSGPSGPSGRVRALRQYQGELYAGGEFPAGLSRWDGTSWQGAGAGTDGWIYELAVWDDAALGHVLVVGGLFTQPFQRNIAAWDGAVWQPLGRLDSPVTALVVHDDLFSPRLYAASLGGVWTWEGAVDGWREQVAMDRTVGALASVEEAPGPVLYLGGSFSQQVTRHGIPDVVDSGHLARWARPLTCSDDNPSPTIDLAQPVDGAWTSSGAQRFVGILSDSVVLSLNHQPVALATDLSFDHGPVTLQEGPNAFTLEAIGADGQSDVRSVTVLRDTVAPEIAFVSPAAGALVPSGTVALQLSYSDTGIGVDPATLELLAQSGPLASDCVTTVSGAVCTLSTPLADGPATLRASIADRLGHRSGDAVLLDHYRQQLREHRDDGHG